MLLMLIVMNRSENDVLSQFYPRSRSSCAYFPVFIRLSGCNGSGIVMFFFSFCFTSSKRKFKIYFPYDKWRAYRLARTFWRRYKTANLERKDTMQLTNLKPFVTNACPTPSIFFLVNPSPQPPIIITKLSNRWPTTSPTCRLKMEPIEHT